MRMRTQADALKTAAAAVYMDYLGKTPKNSYFWRFSFSISIKRKYFNSQKE